MTPPDSGDLPVCADPDCGFPHKPDSGEREVTTEPRGARFTILPDSENADRNYIILDVPPSQAQALYDKVVPVLAVSTDSAVTPDTLIGVYLEVEPHPCMNIGRKGEEMFPRPPSLLCGDGVHLPPALAQRILAALESYMAGDLQALAAELRAIVERNTPDQRKGQP